jgi:hypothetical protein
MVQAAYQQTVFPRLLDNQSVMLVPGSWGSNLTSQAGWCNLTCGDAKSARDAYDFYNWALAEERVVGLAPWNWGGCEACARGTPPDEIGTAAMPESKTAWIQIGKAISRKSDGIDSADTVALRLNSKANALVSDQSGLCAEAVFKSGADVGEVVQMPCNASNPWQQWSYNISSAQLRLETVPLPTPSLPNSVPTSSPSLPQQQAQTHAPMCIQVPNIPAHNGKPDGYIGVYGLPTGEETPTNCMDTCHPWVNQTTILEADRTDNETYVNHSPPLNPGNGAPIDYYEAVVWPRHYGAEAEGGRVYWMTPIRFTHYMLPCDGPDGTQCTCSSFRRIADAVGYRTTYLQ